MKTRCDWCKNPFEAEQIIPMESDERLCAGCYFCWQNGAPILKRDEQEMAFQMTKGVNNGR